MAQAITDVKTFLEDARQAVVELAEFEKQEETLAQEEKKRLRVLETERKAVADAVNSTVKKRRDEIEKSYDDELGKLQDKLKRTRTRREKAKNQGIKERIKEELPVKAPGHALVTQGDEGIIAQFFQSQVLACQCGERLAAHQHLVKRFQLHHFQAGLDFRRGRNDRKIHLTVFHGLHGLRGGVV